MVSLTNHNQVVKPPLKKQTKITQIQEQMTQIDNLRNLPFNLRNLPKYFLRLFSIYPTIWYALSVTIWARGLR